MTVKSKKRRLQRARAHQAQSKGKAQFFDAFEQAGGRKLAPFQKEIVKTVLHDDLSKMTVLGNSVTGVATPSRAKCPTCGFSHKVRKNGTMSRHDVFIGSDPRECEGSGKAWNA